MKAGKRQSFNSSLRLSSVAHFQSSKENPFHTFQSRLLLAFSSWDSRLRARCTEQRLKRFGGGHSFTAVDSKRCCWIEIRPATQSSQRLMEIPPIITSFSRRVQLIAVSPPAPRVMLSTQGKVENVSKYARSVRR